MIAIGQVIIALKRAVYDDTDFDDASTTLHQTKNNGKVFRVHQGTKIK